MGRAGTARISPEAPPRPDRQPRRWRRGGQATGQGVSPAFRLFAPAALLARSRLVAAYHSRTVLSAEALARDLPSGLQDTDRTEPVCPRSTARCWPVAAYHSRTVLSPALARVLPSGLQDTE
jgi:hypothetical protein